MIAVRPAKLIAAIGLILLLSVVNVRQIFAQSPPPHLPGTICVTPQFWCWAQPAGSVGSPCLCLGPKGAVSGFLR
jgi:hypothetical protein